MEIDGDRTAPKGMALFAETLCEMCHHEEWSFWDFSRSFSMQVIIHL